MLHKPLPSSSPISTDAVGGPFTFQPVWLALWKRLKGAVSAQSAKPSTVEVLPHHSVTLELARRTVLVVQQGSCTIVQPMQWQAERVYQPQVVLKEGDAWEVPHNASYQMHACVAPQGADQGTAGVTIAVCQPR